ncbi:hydroxyisourate hydrolase [Acuticoccus sp. M5D2P5]|uniref:hydroxyisourate hydrolase n=1 Tax=Acuticoccus kalidii TaxID=2910977 RepID=UPI001F2DB6A7|nr:hydroxyisourate hydrolase [Acuticoccus kalidii]MCF3933561.1 hydroxyisourate hydrolase [Acuticoccus kalidii]
MAGYLTTHVLDTAHGIPASGVAITLCDADGNEITRATTNADGRVETPLLAGDQFRADAYTLEFEVGDYFRRLGVDLADPAFLDTVVIAFGISDEEAHYHVPLLVSPYGYSTYRGS